MARFDAFDAHSGDSSLPEASAAPVPTEKGAMRAHLESDAMRVQNGLATFIHNYLPRLTAEQLEALVDALPASALEALMPQSDDDEADYGADFSIADEIAKQLKAVQALRESVFPKGRLKLKAGTREAKEVLTTCNQMIKTLMDNHERIMNLERMRAVEIATVEVLADLDPSLKEQFLERLELRLAENAP